MGRPENVFGNDLKNDSLSVHDRPAYKTNVFMIRDNSLANKVFRNR